VAERHRPRRNYALLAVLIVVACGAIGYGVWRAADRVRPTASHTKAAAVPTGEGHGVPAGTVASSAPPPVNVAPRGANTFTYAATAGPVLGRAGTLKRFRVAVENGTGQDANAFAAAADRALGDPRSWIGGAQWRLQRVPKTAAAEFTIYLASQVTTEQMCAAGGLHTMQFASCRLPGQVIINLTRWLTAVPDYGAPLDTYQLYALNHEVGHELGHGHEACPGPGKPAPVMQQQTFGLKGCVANPWPYVDGQRYAGPPSP
jgi:hypothetical protein